MKELRRLRLYEFQAHITARPSQLTVAHGRRYRNQCRDMHYMVLVDLVTVITNSNKVRQYRTIKTTRIRGDDKHESMCNDLLRLYINHLVSARVVDGWAYRVVDIFDTLTGMHYHPEDWP